jgi:hypothetical protein
MWADKKSDLPKNKRNRKDATMNKFMIIAALALAGSPALASKARIGALNNSRQLVDVQYTFERPYLLSSVGELAIIEWGQAQPTDTAVASHAEGGFIKKNGDSYFGLYFGRKSDDFTGGIRQVNAGGGTLLEEQNPINLLFASKTGDYSWGLNLKYSNGSDDTGSKKVSTSGIALGATNGKWQGELVLGLSGKSEQTGVTAESKGNMKATVGYLISDMMQAYVDYKQVKTDVTVGAATTSPETTSMHVGFINTIVKNDDANFFYGVAYSSAKTDGTAAGNSEVTGLPVWMGIEANATSWMVFRASLQQNVILNETKAVAGTKTDLDSIAFAGGAGFKLGKGLLDVSFGTGAANGNFDYASAGFLAQTAYTYTF